MSETIQDLINETIKTILEAHTKKRLEIFFREVLTNVPGMPIDEYYWCEVNPVTGEGIKELTMDNIKEILNSKNNVD